MIRYALKCDQNHSFESWFQNADAFDALTAAGHVSCPECGSSEVAKSLMAPKVRPARSAAVKPDLPEAAPAPSAPAPAPHVAPSAEVQEEIAAEIAKLRAKVEAESDYVGEDFAKEARAIHLGEAPERAIYGETKLDDAKELIEDGVPVMPLPFTPTKKVN